MVTPPMARCDRRVKETRRRKADSTKGVQQKKKGANSEAVRHKKKL
jgi:hypothetical protein